MSLKSYFTAAERARRNGVPPTTHWWMHIGGGDLAQSCITTITLTKDIMQQARNEYDDRERISCKQCRVNIAWLAGSFIF